MSKTRAFPAVKYNVSYTDYAHIVCARPH